MNNTAFDYVVMTFGANGLVTRGIKKIYPRFGLLDTDVILATFPKSGTTWIRFIFANIISLSELGGRQVDYQLLNGDLVAGYDTNRYPRIKYSTLPRIVATHMPYRPKRFNSNRKIYLYRNPADTLVSYFEYMKSHKGTAKYQKQFGDFIRDGEYGLEAWCRHVKGWIKNADSVLTYEELKLDPAGVINRVLADLEIVGIDDGIVKEAVARSSFDSIRNMEDTIGLDKRARDRHEPGAKFARKGKVGGWKDYFNDDDLELLEYSLKEAGLDYIEIPV